MKVKFVLFCALSAAFTFYSVSGSVLPQLNSLPGSEYVFYVSGKVEDAPLITKVINSGAGSIVYCKPENAEEVRKTLPSISGESLETHLSAKEVLTKLNYNIVDVSYQGDIKIYYAYSVKSFEHIVVNGSKVNLQVAETDYGTVVGYPVILGSY